MPERSRAANITEEDYLLREEIASVRHEFVDGSVYAMTGSTDAHNLICVNMLVAIQGRLRNSACRAYINDMKVKIAAVKSYYYPDIMVTCENFDAKSVSKSHPVLIVEVLSPSTAIIDLREKLRAYKKISSLIEYAIVHQDRQRIDLYRRDADGWEIIVFSKGEELVLESLPTGRLTLPLDSIYEGYDPPGRVKESGSAYELHSESELYAEYVLQLGV